MDFGSLLHVAQKQTQNKQNEVKYYSTKFEPPKKEERAKKNLSANIQKFLARKEAEEKRKAEEERIKKLELLALRSQDSKAKRRVQVMLSRTKSANKSAIDDAIDKDNTAVTLAGPSQPDEDDYGYVSQEASAFYNKMMERYSKMPEENKFSSAKKPVSTNLASTKDRVKDALRREEEEALLPHKRKRKSKSAEDKSANDQEADDVEAEKDEKEKKPKFKKPPPPALNFNELLRLAAQKQHEPILIETKKDDSDELLMTKRQKREYEKERASKESREQRERERLAALKATKAGKMDRIPKIPSSDSKNASDRRIPKLNSTSDNKNASEGRIPKLNGSSDGRIPKLNGASDARIPKVDGINDGRIPKLNSSSDGRIPKVNDVRIPKINSASSDGRIPKMSDGKIQKSQGTGDARTQKLNEISRQNSSSSSSKLAAALTSKPSSSDKSADRSALIKYSSSSDKRGDRSMSAIKQSGDRPAPIKSSSSDRTASVRQNGDLKRENIDAKQLNRSSSSYQSSSKIVDRNKIDIYKKSDINSSKPLSSNFQSAKKPEPISAKINSKPLNVPSSSGQYKDVRKNMPSNYKDVKPKQFPPADLKPKQFPPADLKPKQFPPADLKRKQLASANMKPKQFPPPDVRPKQFPPPDVRPKQFPPPDVRPRQFPPSDVKRKRKLVDLKRRRILDDDDEYDSELDDFIDDGPEDEIDYSQEIRNIFGYDKAKFRDFDDDDRDMESNFSRIQKEEYISAKLGMLEDLEDIQKENEEKKRKAMKKKKLK